VPVVVALGDVVSCDASGLALLLRLKSFADAAGVGFELRDVPTLMQRVLAAAGLAGLGSVR